MTHRSEPLASRDEALSELLADAEGDGVASFLLAVESTFATPPSADVEARHVAAILAAAGSASPVVPMRRRPARRWRTIGVIAASMALTLGLLTGLAYAGVRLPSPVRTALSAMGIPLPEQATAEPSPADQNAGEPTLGPGARPSVLASVSVPPQAREEADQSQGGEHSATARGDRPGKRTGDMPDRKGGDSPSNPADECDLPTLLCGI